MEEKAEARGEMADEVLGEKEAAAGLAAAAAEAPLILHG